MDTRARAAATHEELHYEALDRAFDAGDYDGGQGYERNPNTSDGLLFDAYERGWLAGRDRWEHAQVGVLVRPGRCAHPECYDRDGGETDGCHYETDAQ